MSALRAVARWLYRLPPVRLLVDRVLLPFAYRLWTGHKPPVREPGDEGWFG